MDAEMLTYNMDVDSRSRWIRTTPGETALSQPYYCTEAGHFLGGSSFSTARSHKDRYLLFYTIEGSGTVLQKKDQILLRPGDCLLLDCRIPQSYGTSSGSSSWHHYWMHIDGPGVASLASLINQEGRLCVSHMPSQAVSGIFEMILTRLPDDSTDSIMEISLAIHRVLVRMLQTAMQGPEGTDSGNRALISNAAAYIHAHYQEQVTLDDLLEVTHVSKSYLLRLFRQYMGTTPYNFLLRYRITRAKELLALTELPVGEIARRVGFRDESNFSTRFTTIAGASPLQYRKSSIRQES